MNDDYWNAVSPGSKTAVIKTAIKRSFDEWMKAADAACEAKAGLSIHDLSDCPFMDWYEDGVSPSSAASRAIRMEMEGKRKTAEYKYRSDQIDRIAVDDGGFYRVQFSADNGHGETKHMNVSFSELMAIRAILEAGDDSEP